MRLNTKDYKQILIHYNIPIPKKKSNIILKAEKILATKMCRCIKAISKKQPTIKEGKIIGICTKSIFKNRNLKKRKFTCKKKYSLSGLSKRKGGISL